MQLKGKRVQGTICELLFVILSIVVYTVEISGGVISFAMGLLACVAVILMVAGFEEKFGRGMDFLAKYTMPIFLMHTLFAAPMRSILMKIIGINAVIVGNVKIGKHCVIGANSVVTKDVPDYCVAVGSPAKVIKRIEET